MLRDDVSVDDTIVACATPPGEGALAIIRIAGPLALSIGRQIAPGLRFSRSHELKLSTLSVVGGEVVDEGMAVEMRAPRSYTGEDVVEFHVHGARVVVEALQEEVCRLGGRLAGPGEFTLRAVLNGKLDLAQAEAVADLIGASDGLQRCIATSHLRGQLSRQISQLKASVETCLVSWKAALDFPEYVTGSGVTKEDELILKAVALELQCLHDSARIDLRQGKRVALCGAPNVGKSSLLNRWAGERRVIVHAAPGTTRDPVQVRLEDGQAQWVVVDTAGIRKVAGELESIGIEMSHEQAATSDVVLWLVDPIDSCWPEPEFECLVVGAKGDLADPGTRLLIEAEACERGLDFVGWISSLTREGVDELRARIAPGQLAAHEEGQVVIVRQRQLAALVKAIGALSRFEKARVAGMSLDVLVMDIEEAVRSLGAILGEDVDQIVFERVFADFCIGK